MPSPSNTPPVFTTSPISESSPVMPSPLPTSTYSLENASVKHTTTAEGRETYGALNCHPTDDSSPFRVGVSVDTNKKCRRTMEDAHSFVYDFGGIFGQGFFAVFDGHAGKHAAEWCGKNFHQVLLENLLSDDKQPIPEVLNTTFLGVDSKLAEVASHSGCTAVTVFLRLEDEEGRPVGSYGNCGSGVAMRKVAVESASYASSSTSPIKGKKEKTPEDVLSFTALQLADPGMKRKKSVTQAVKGQLKGMISKSNSHSGINLHGLGKGHHHAKGSSVSHTPIPPEKEEPSSMMVEVLGPAEVQVSARRTLYTANVGDARAVLSRKGKAVRLTYDHKGSDVNESKRITDAGGFVLNHRVNGVLAVTRSLGDKAMKEFVVGHPYTTETVLQAGDSWLIVACDGLWDVCSDQEAVDLIKDLKDPQQASEILLQHALDNFSSDNLSVLVISL